MAQVPDQVLQWLYSVLHEYHEPNQAYTDSARTLAVYSSLSPRTEVYTYENGSSALLLTLSGTLPVAFRGTTYRYPLKIWIPHRYPQQSPMVYITPGRDMAVRPGQHVDVQGRVYHPYLRDWATAAGGYGPGNVSEFLNLLSQVFEREPPVVSRAQQQVSQARPADSSYGQQQGATANPIPPQLPPKPGSVGPVEMPSVITPPPKPPKPGEERTERTSSRTSARDYSRDGPPLPPLPGERPPQQTHSAQSDYLQRQNGRATPPRPAVISPQAIGYNAARPSGPPLPPLPPQQQQHQQQHPHQQSQYQQYQQQRSNHDRSPVSPVSPVAPRPDFRYAQAAPVPFQPHTQPSQAQQQQFHQQQRQPPQQYPHQNPAYQQATSQQPPLPQQQHQYPPPQSYPPYQQKMPVSHQQQTSAAPDLLTDPFDVTLPSQPVENAPAPPIPPNPEKEHLLHALSLALVQQAQQRVSQNLSAVAPLQAQQYALRLAHDRLQAEISQLEHLTATLERNERILHESIAQCDHTIANAKRKPQPPIDDVLVPTTVVANQLWMLCAEEAGIREAMYVLQKGLDRGRISGPDFVKQMRTLGREAFQKKALARKVARGLGLQEYG